MFDVLLLTFNERAISTKVFYTSRNCRELLYSRPPPPRHRPAIAPRARWQLAIMLSLPFSTQWLANNLFGVLSEKEEGATFSWGWTILRSGAVTFYFRDLFFNFLPSHSNAAL